MAIHIVEEAPDLLTQYETVPIAFHVKSYFRVALSDNGLGGIQLIEQAVTPYIKDYDENEDDRPTQWARRWDITSWGILAAFTGNQRIGGAAVAWRTHEINLLQGSDNVACLWDLRVHPQHRNQGVGRQLFDRAMTWARDRGCQRLVVETQNINVPACRFYERQGCELGAINRFAYDRSLNEVQLLWYQSL